MSTKMDKKAGANILQAGLNGVKLKYPTLLNNSDLRKHQKAIIEKILEGQNVYASLPTGYGKTLTYILPGLLLDEESPEISHTTLVVSPLLSLMDEQAGYLNNAGIKTVCVSSNMTNKDQKDLYAGKAKMIFTTPEAASHTKFRKELRRVYGPRLVLISVDETHLVTAWGDTFRDTYKKVPELAALFRAPFIFLTATSTQVIQDGILDLFSMKGADIVSVLPDRPDIRLDVHGGGHSFRLVNWAIERVRTKGLGAPKTVIFTSRIREVSELYDHAMEVLGDDAFRGGVWKAENRYIEMFHSGISAEREDYVMQTFRQQNSIVRLVLATIKLGMGIDIPDIACVIILGAPSNILDLWQQVGRCARQDGLKGHGVLYLTPLSLQDCEDENVLQLAEAKDSCKREILLKAFHTNDSKEESNPTVNLCDLQCRRPCECSLCCCCNYCAFTCNCPNKDSRLFCVPRK